MIPGHLIFGFVMVSGAWLRVVWRMGAHATMAASEETDDD